jgi:hypothetical protein
MELEKALTGRIGPSRVLSQVTSGRVLKAGVEGAASGEATSRRSSGSENSQLPDRVLDGEASAFVLEQSHRFLADLSDDLVVVLLDVDVLVALRNKAQQERGQSSLRTRLRKGKGR